MATLQAIRYTRGTLELLDQRRLPTETVFLKAIDTRAAFVYIRDMVVRGAPAIGVTAALSMAVELVTKQASDEAISSAADVSAYVTAALQVLVTSRPTAVNLADACNKLTQAAKDAAAARSATAASVVEAVVEAAEAYHQADLAINQEMTNRLNLYFERRIATLVGVQEKAQTKTSFLTALIRGDSMVARISDLPAIGRYGAEALARATGKSSGLRVMTCCNTGSLATSGYGTALGVVRKLHSDNLLEHVFATETRPYNQGSRLTAYELVYENIPGTLICDSMAAYKMSLGEVDAIVVGADRVTANGDTANKIGTYALAVAAQFHKIPFFVAAPATSIDISMATGAEIPIEQRSSQEITHSFGNQVAADGIQVWNPAFDVTPGSLIHGIITEFGVAYKTSPEAGKEASHDLQSFLKSHTSAVKLATNTFTPLGDSDVLKSYVQTKVEVAAFLGGDPCEWSTKEVGDGNINFVYLIEGPSNSIVVKQALPYVRCVGESWPLAQDRARLEAEALMEEARLCPAHVPKVWLYDDAMKTIFMRFIEPPHIILRKGLCQGVIYPHLAEHMAEFMASTLFHTSRLAMSEIDFREAVSKRTNVAMCAITEQVIFLEPYGIAENNRHTSPELDDVVAALRQDNEAKQAISQLKHKFVENCEAFLHGDLHTGSMMCTPESSLVIDPEFAYYGPMGFDIGSFLANLFLAYFSQEGHANSDNQRTEMRDWLKVTIIDTWELFLAKFLALWNARVADGAPIAAYPDLLFSAQISNGAEALANAQKHYMKNLFKDTIAFMGCEIIRRIVGIAHVEDLESIADQSKRAACEKKALSFAREMMVNPESVQDIRATMEAAEK